MRKAYYFLFHGIIFSASLFILFFREVRIEFVLAAVFCGFNILIGIFPKSTGKFTQRTTITGRFIRLINYTIRQRNRQIQESEIKDIRKIERVNVNSVIATIVLALSLLSSGVFVDIFSYLEEYDWLPIVMLILPYLFFAGRYILFDKPTIESNREDSEYMKEGVSTFTKGLAFISFFFGFFMLFFIEDAFTLLSEGSSGIHQIFSMGFLGLPIIFLLVSWGYTLVYFLFLRK